MSALGQPFFEIAGGFDDIHAANDSDGEKEKSNKRRKPFHHRDTESQRRTEERINYRDLLRDLGVLDVCAAEMKSGARRGIDRDINPTPSAGSEPPGGKKELSS